MYYSLVDSLGMYMFDLFLQKWPAAIVAGEVRAQN